MFKRYPADQTSLPLSLNVYNQLQWASCNTGYQREDWEIATEAIDEWVRRHDPNALQGLAHAGYQWKRLFLPAGTVLRTVFGGKNHHCLVEGDRIMYEKRAVSPSGFVNAVGGIRRNAWKTTWILFPDSKDWKLADSLRTRDRPARARKIARTVQAEPSQENPHDHRDIQPLPAQRTEVRPYPDKQSRVVRPAQRGRSALAAFKSRHAAHAFHEPTQLTRDGVLRAPDPDSKETPSPVGFTREQDRRNDSVDRMAALLRQQLIPLLCQVSSLDRRQTTDSSK